MLISCFLLFDLEHCHVKPAKLLYPSSLRRINLLSAALPVCKAAVKCALTGPSARKLLVFSERFTHNEKMEKLKLDLLGHPRVSYLGETLEVQNRPLALICFLALEEREQFRSRKNVTETLWGLEKGSSLRNALSKLRQLPGAEHWLEDDDPLKVHAQIDLTLLKDAQGGEGFSEDVLSILDRLADVETDLFLPGLEAPTKGYEEWLGGERRGVDKLVGELLPAAAEYLHKRGEYDRARAYAEGLVTRNDQDEDAYQLLMKIEYDSGHPENVYRVFERCRVALGREPSKETFKLLRQLVGGGRGAYALLLRRGDRVPGQAAQLIGRGEQLKDIEGEMRGQPVLLHGLGGVGKTALAAKLASSRLSKGNVLWVQADTSSADELVVVAGQALNLQGAAQPEVLQQALERFDVVLVVLDDVWNERAVSEFRPFLPETLPLLVTSRQRLKGIKRHDVGRLERDDARRLLAFEADRELDEPGADSVCEALGDHPFALRLAGAKLKNDGMDPQGLLTQLANAPHTLQTPKGWREEGRESISALLQASLETLSDDAYDAFLAVGSLTSGSVTAPLLSRVVRRDLEATDVALIELHTRALAERVASPRSDMERYVLHDLSHSFARQNTTLRTQTVIRACRDLVAEFGTHFETLDAEIANVVGSLDAAREEGDRQVLVDVMAELVVGEAYFSARGHAPRSLSLLATAVEWAKEREQYERAHDLAGRLGDAYRVQYHDYEKALEAYSEGVELARYIENLSREAILTSLCGIVQHHLGHPPKKAFERAYQLAKQADDPLALGQVLQHRGYVAGFRDDWEAVERFSTEAVEVARSAKEDCSVNQTRVDYNLFFALLNLGEAKRNRHKLEEAVAKRKEALEIAEKRDNQMWQAVANHELGITYLDKRQPEEAKNSLEKALNLYEANHARAKVLEVQQLLSGMNQ